MRHVQRVRSHVQLSEPTEDGLRAAHGTGSHVAPLFDPDDDRAQPLRKRALTRVIRSITILGWIRQYSRVDLFGDLRSGLTVSVILVPQAIAYALLVEVQPVYGLYSAFVPLFAYAIFTTARHVSIGPFALLSLVVASVAKGLVPTDHTDAVRARGSTHAISQLRIHARYIVWSQSDPRSRNRPPFILMRTPSHTAHARMQEYLSCVLTLSVLSGIVQIVMGCVGLGVIASLLADPCIAGFTTAVALIIMASQVRLAGTG
jgi:MFS superfamily sulfate permease-like transporter